MYSWFNELFTLCRWIGFEVKDFRLYRNYVYLVVKTADITKRLFFRVLISPVFEGDLPKPFVLLPEDFTNYAKFPKIMRAHGF